MPRPKDGYRNRAGQPIPGVHDVTSRFMDTTALKFWAYKQGREGRPMFDRSAIDIGTVVHSAAELHLRNEPIADIEFYIRTSLPAADDLDKAMKSFAAFCAWREQFHVRALAQEVTMISEKHQYGGTPDVIAVIGNTLGLLDFKTSADVYPDHLVAMAAHGKLWMENNPDKPLASYHLICLPKDGSRFKHYAYNDLTAHWKLFKGYRKCFDLDKFCSDKAVLKGGIVPPPVTQQEKSKAARKPAAAKAKATGPTCATALHMSMAEILRTYGHVREGAPA